MTEVRRRLKSAHDRLGAAKTLLDSGHNPDAINRAYYGVFEAARALLLMKEVEASTHAGIGNRLGFHYREEIDTRVFSRLRKEREGVDYELSRPGEERAELCVEQAQSFIEASEALIESA